MTIYSKDSIAASYERTRRAGIEHDQAVRAVSQALVLDTDTVADAVEAKRIELDAEQAEAVDA